MKKTNMILCAALLAFGSVACTGNKEKGASDSAKAVAGAPAASGAEVGELYKVNEEGNLVSTAGHPMIVDFFATWCPPCRELKPTFESFKTKYEGSITFASIDVDRNQELAARYQVQSIPTLIFIAPDGRELGRLVGLQSPADLQTAIDRTFPVPSQE